MTFQEYEKNLTDRFAAAGIDSPEYEAGWLIEETGKLSRSRRLSLAPDVLPEELFAAAEKIARRREKREPLQYLLGKSYFMDLELEVTPAVLIPRPETELLAEFAIQTAPAGGKLLDVGTGSGAIALAVASARPDLAVTGVDVSAAALEVAGRNREHCQLKNVRFLKSDLFSALSGEKFDFIAGNLPYVSEEEYPLLQQEVRDFEPELALTAPEEGFALIRQCVLAAGEHLTGGGTGAWELSPAQAPKLAALLERNHFRKIAIHRDYNGRDRFVSGKICKEE